MAHLSRRQFLTAVGAGGAGLALAGCGGPVPEPALVMPNGSQVSFAEARRRGAGARVREFTIVAAPTTVDLGGLPVPTWAYGGTVPGPEVRVRAGEVVRARFENRLPEPSTIHWHGIALRNDMDGVPGLTQQAVPPGGAFTYEFTAPDPGTYWFHPHSGLQLDRGLYAPLIVDDPADAGTYDRELVVVLDDWIDGLGKSPEEALGELQRGEGAHAAHIAAEKAGGGPGTTGGDFLGGRGSGDVLYPLYLVNGRGPGEPFHFTARPRERLRLRIVNAAAETPFRVALGGHRMTVTHADGFPVDPVTVDTLVVAMAERYDVLVTVAEAGVFPLVAVAEAKAGSTLAVLDASGASGGSGPWVTVDPSVRPGELAGRVLVPDDLHAAQAVRLPEGRPRRTYVAELGGGDAGYVWTINGRPHGQDEPLGVRDGERVRLVFHNTTTMFHPMHLHGHTFQVVLPSGLAGARKDTTIVRPGQRVAVDFVADNPGQWMLHCHNLYHQVGGMMTTVSYVTDGAPGPTGAASPAGQASRARLVCDWLARPLT